MQKNKTVNSHSWEAELKIISKMQVIIPVKLLLICNQIAGKVNGNEFSIVTDIKEKEASKLVLADNFYVPKQKVSSGHIDYLPDVYSHKVCIHRHPDGYDSFSGTDREFINQNFEMSLLFTKSDGFVNGIYNLKTAEDTIIQLPVEIVVDYELEPIDITNIDMAKDLILLEDKSAIKKKVSHSQEKVYTNDDLEYMESRINMIEESMLMDRRFEFGNF